MINEIQSGEGVAIDIPPGVIVFCDMDGTLVDTDYANYLSYREAVIEATRGTQDVDYTDERLNRERLKKRLPSLTDSQLEVIAALKSEYFKEFLSDTRLNNALAQIIFKHRNKNTIVLVTRCREKRVVQVLEYHKMLDCFTRLICYESLLKVGLSNKYESAMSLMRARQESVLIFENDNTDIEEAMLAGVPKRNIYRVMPKLTECHEPI
jgi:phosphoglycolate phosphatase-like HAD superfamily hydrolase